MGAYLATVLGYRESVDVFTIFGLTFAFILLIFDLKGLKQVFQEN